MPNLFHFNVKNMKKLSSKVKWTTIAGFWDYQISKFISRANQKTVCKMPTFDVECIGVPDHECQGKFLLY